MMLDLLMKSTQSENDTIVKYLEKEKRDANKQLEKFKIQKEREKEEKLKELNQMRENREQELREKEQNLLNWEDKIKDEEAK